MAHPVATPAPAALALYYCGIITAKKFQKAIAILPITGWN